MLCSSRSRCLAVALTFAVGCISAQDPKWQAGDFVFAATDSGAQAQTAAELDSFGLVIESHSPLETVANAEHFRATFPQSQFRAQATLREMRAEIALGSYTVAVSLGKELILRQPENLEAQLLLAEILPSFPPGYKSKEAALAEAAKCLSAARDLLVGFHKPPAMGVGEFLANKRALTVRVHEAAGFQALVSQHYSQAISEYESAKAKNGDCSQLTRLRLGAAYLFAHRTVSARQELEWVRAHGDDSLRRSASQLLVQIPSTHPAGQEGAHQ